MDRLSTSTVVFIGLVVLNAILAGAITFMPQGTPLSMPEGEIDPLPLALMNAALVLFLYGGLGYIGLRLTRKLGYPDLLDARVTNRQRFLNPCIVGLWLGLLFIVADNLFGRLHPFGPLPHPPFPTSILASLSAGIGEEMVFRLFFIPLLVWLISHVVLKGEMERPVFWNAAIFSGVFFAVGHFPSVMLLLGLESVPEIPMPMMAELFLLNGTLSLVAAYFLRRSGYLAAVTVHTSANIVWHVLWGLLR